MFSYLTVYLLLFIILWFLVFFLFFSFNYVRLITYYYLIILLLFIYFLILFFNKLIIGFHDILLIALESHLNINYILNIDGLSFVFMFLSVFLILFCFLIYWNVKYENTLYIFMLLFSLWLLINIFSLGDFFFFYIFFEAIIIPMFFLIGVWGARSRKVNAAYLFFIYTLFGSVFIFISFLGIYFYIGSSSFEYFLNSHFFYNRLLIFWFLMFVGLSIKVPMMPFHIWLPEAHVEAPTPGSVILAGLLLKLGLYAVLRLLLINFHYVQEDLVFFLLIWSLFGFLYSSLIAFAEIDIKKIIAYSSIAHMNFSLFGLFSNNILGISGLLVLMVGHALTSGALFLGIGVLYDRYKTRLIFYYGALIQFMPIFGIIYFILILANFGCPGTVNFVGEFLILTGGFQFSNVIIFFSTLGMILSLIYSLFLYNRIFFGSLPKLFIRYYSDVHRLEFLIIVIFVIFVVIFGFFPSIMISFFSSFLDSLVFFKI